MLSYLTITQRIWIIISLSVIIYAGVHLDEIHHQRDELLIAKRSQLQAEVDSAHRLISFYHQQVALGALSEPDAQRAALQAVGALRDGNRYLWINNTASQTLMHAPAPDGRPPGTVNDLNSTRPELSISYRKAFAPWGWVVGNGQYLTDIDDELNQKMTDYWRYFAVGLGIITGLAWALYQTVVPPLRRTITAINEMSLAPTKQPPRLDEQGKDELAQLGRGFNHLVSQLENSTEFFKHRVEERTKELFDNLKRLNIALNSSRQGWFDFNIQTGECQVSDQYAQLLGYATDEFQPSYHNWLDNVHPDDRQAISKIYNQCKAHGGPFELEYRRKTPQGRWLWMQSVGEFIEWDSQNNPLRCTGVHTDISHRKRIELRDNQRSEVLEKLLKDEPLDTILEHISFFVEQERPGSLCSIMLINEQATLLHLITASAGIPDFYNRAIDGTKVSNELGSCNTAAYTKQRVIVEDIQTHPYWLQFRGVAAKARLAACWSEPIIGADNQLLGTFAIYHHQPTAADSEDFKLLEFAAQLSAITIERSQSQEKLRLSSRVFSDTSDGILITDHKGKILDINPAFTTITGFTRNDAIGRYPSDLDADIQHPSQNADMRQSLNDKGHWQDEVWYHKKNGQRYALRVSVSSLRRRDGETSHSICSFSDITQTKQQQRELELMAHYDVLTQLPNRSLFADRFTQAIAHCHRTKTLLAVCFLDLDNFKPVNDSYGHQVGDQLLIAIAERLKSDIREGDTVSRQGGDEFALLLGELQSTAHCKQTLTRIQKCLATPYVIAGQTLHVSVSIGITLYPNDSADLDTLLRHADQSMYQAKLAGKNRFQIFNPELDQQAVEKHHIQDEIRLALAASHFCLYYQPKVNMKSGEVFGAEALIRWLHPDNGVVSPLDFLPMIEGTELEILLGDWVINEALRQLARWQQQGIGIELSLNIAPHHLQSPSFINQLANALAAHPTIDASDLQLEILESSVLSDLDAVRCTLNHCQGKFGINIALDDFGTGYSSLTHLRNLPANTLKIDQSFVKNMLTNTDDHAIVNGVLGLANSFHRNVIAEGVETTEHGLMLLAMGCELAQGYGISRPMPASEFPLWLENYRPNQQWLNAVASTSPRTMPLSRTPGVDKKA